MRRICEARTSADYDTCRHCGARIEIGVRVHTEDDTYTWFNLPCRHPYALAVHRNRLTATEAATALLMLES